MHIHLDVSNIGCPERTIGMTGAASRVTSTKCTEPVSLKSVLGGTAADRKYYEDTDRFHKIYADSTDFCIAGLSLNGSSSEQLSTSLSK